MTIVNHDPLAPGRYTTTGLVRAYKSRPLHEILNVPIPRARSALSLNASVMYSKGPFGDMLHDQAGHPGTV